MSQDRLPRPRNIHDYSIISEKDYSFISLFAKENFGLNLTEAKRPLVHSRLSRRLRELGIKDFSKYRQLLLGPNGSAEQSSLLSALTTNVTEFFRETHHFNSLQENIIPKLKIDAKHGKSIRIWSAGCSTGQEPYSVAMTILDNFADAPNYDVKVIATDIDPNVISIARAGIYDKKDVSKIPNLFLDKFFQKAQNDSYITKEILGNIVEFSTLNLIKEINLKCDMDVIFCRNVAIYFDKSTQENTWLKFSRTLKNEGTLFIGHSERVSGPAASHFTPCGITSYRKSKS